MREKITVGVTIDKPIICAECVFCVIDREFVSCALGYFEPSEEMYHKLQGKMHEGCRLSDQRAFVPDGKIRLGNGVSILTKRIERDNNQENLSVSGWM